MEAKELRIGNLVTIDNKVRLKDSGKTLTVMGVADESIRLHNELDVFGQLLKFIKPIPLTEEWLLNFGFEEDSCNYYKIIENQEAVLYIDKLDTTFAYGYPYECSGGDLKLKHVHQLQNLYHALTGEELTIKK